MLAKKTLNQMNRHIAKLEEGKKKYIERAKTAKRQGLDASYNLAISGLKATMAQQKRAQEMLLNFEIVSDMRDMSALTTEFLDGMGRLSKEMCKLTSEKQFAKVQQDFEKAMMASEKQTMNMELFLDDSQATFASQSGVASTESDAEIEALIIEKASQDDIGADNIDAELEKIRNKLNG